MRENIPHRKTIQRFNTASHAHLLTFSCYQRYPIFNNEKYRAWFSGGLDRTLEKQNYKLIAFVYMPEHLHLLVWPSLPEYSISALLFALKRPLSFKIKRDMEQHGDPWLKKLTIRDRPDHTSFRFWQEGSGFDRNLQTTQSCMTAAEYLHNNPVRRNLCATPAAYRWSSWKFFHAPDEYRQDSSLPLVHGFPG
jgi:putative transposase